MTVMVFNASIALLAFKIFVVVVESCLKSLGIRINPQIMTSRFTIVCKKQQH